MLATRKSPNQTGLSPEARDEMPQFNHKNQQFMDYRITLIGSSETSSKLVKRLEKVFERRRVADSTAGDGTRTIVMRDQTVVVFRQKRNGAASAFREPFVEMDVRTTEDYKSRSVAAMRGYAQTQNLLLYVEVEPVKPNEQEGRKSSRRPAPSERPQE